MVLSHSSNSLLSPSTSTSTSKVPEKTRTGYPLNLQRFREPDFEESIKRKKRIALVTGLMFVSLPLMWLFALALVNDWHREFPSSILNMTMLITNRPHKLQARRGNRTTSIMALPGQAQDDRITTKIRTRKVKEDEDEDDEDNKDDNENDEDEKDDKDNSKSDEDDSDDSDDSDDDEDEDEDEDEDDEDEKDDQDDQDEGSYEDDEYSEDVYIDDDVVDDDFYAFIEDPGPPRLFPLTSGDVAAFLIASMTLTLGASGGLGGGGIVVPVYILVMGLQTKAAIPLGAVTVLGGSIASTLANLSRRHPLADRPIIDWDLVLVMEPLTLIGTLMGTLLHRVLSEKLLIVLLVLLLSISAQSTLAKAKRMYNAETKYIKHLIAAKSDAKSRLSPDGMQKYWAGTPRSIHGVDSTDVPELRSPGSYRSLNPEERQQILILNPDFVTLRSGLMEEEKFTPRSKIIALCCMFSILIFLNMMVGGGAFQSPWGILCGSAAFWVVQVIMVAFLISSAWAAQTYLVNRHEIKEIVRFDYVHGDIKWDARSAIVYPALFVSTGIFAGLFGIGGGMITVPLMLAMGVHPAVVSSTSSAMILFTSFASSTSYFVFGLILKDYAVVCLLIGFFASLFGQKIMRQARQAKTSNGDNFERNSYIAFCIGGVILLSALLMTIEYVFKVLQYDDVNEEEQGGLCEGYRI